MGLGERLRYAREAAGLHQSDAAREIGISDTGISEMESGRRQPKAAQLARLASLYNRSMDFFFSTVPLAPEVVLWRCRPSDEATAKRRQREFFSLCEDYQEIEDLTGSARPSALPKDATPRERFGYLDAERLAASIWEQFELGTVPAESLRPVLEEKYNVRIFAQPMRDEASAASTMNPRFGPAVLLNRDSKHWRRNFDLAHELFHLLTWDVFRSREEDSSVVADEDEESWANCFASRLLLPEASFRERVGPYIGPDGTLRITPREIHDLARAFDVSAEAIVYRFASLLRWRKEETRGVIDRVQTSPFGRESPPVESLPSRYVFLVVQAYRQGMISYGKGAQYLRMSHKAARDFLEPPEDDFESDRQITITSD